MNKRFVLLIAGCCLSLSFVFGQYEKLVHKTNAERTALLVDFYQHAMPSADSVVIFDTINQIRKLAIDNHDDELLMEATLLQLNYFFYRHFPQQVLLPLIDSVKEIAIKNKKLWAEILTENIAALYNFHDLQNYQLGFEHHQRVYHLIKDLSPAEFPHKQNCLMQIADEYYFFSDFRESAFYNKEALEAEPLIKLHPYPMNINVLNTLGLCYQQLNMLDSSDFYFHRCFEMASKYNNSTWQSISNGNMGYNLFLRKKYDEAIPLLENDVENAVKISDWGLASGSLMVLGNISLIRNDIAGADKQLETARTYIYRSGQYERLQRLYPLLVKLYAAESKPALAAIFMDSAIFVRDSVSRKLNALQLLRAKQKVDLEIYRAEIINIKNLKKINVLERNALIIVVLFIVIGAFSLYNVQRKKYRRQKEQTIKAEEELLASTKQLEDFAKNISEKNNLIEMLQNQSNPGSEEILKELQQSTILTGADWEYFRGLFEKVHNGYLQRLKEKIPDLTAAETRFMVLSKLGLSAKEMANMLGVGNEAIRQYRLRLRKKLNLTEEGTLEDLVSQI